MLSGCGGGGHFANPAAPTGGGLTSHYRYTDLGLIGPGGTVPIGINDAGVITGYFNHNLYGDGPILPVLPSNSTNPPFRHTGATPIVAADALALPAANAGSSISVSGINASGTVVGSVDTVTTASAAVQDAFLYDTALHDLGSLPLAISGGSVASATAINDGGTVIGYDNFIDQESTHSFRHTGTGPLTAADDLGTFGSYQYVQALGINQAGVIVGTAMTADGHTQHAFVYDSSFHDLGTLPGNNYSVAVGISRSGVVVGYGSIQNEFHSFRHAGTGPLTAADDMGQLPGSSGLDAAAINAGGDVVGQAGETGGTATAFVLKAGRTLQGLTDSTLVPNLPAGVTLQIATGINTQGQVVGYTNVGGFQHIAHAWLLTPTP